MSSEREGRAGRDSAPWSASMPPSASSAARRASSGVMPARMLSSMWQLQGGSRARRRSIAVARGRAETRASRSSQARSALMTAAPRREESREDRGRALPVARFLVELFPARPGEPVELRLAVVVGDAPLRGDVALLLELEQGRVEGAVVERQVVRAGLLDAPRDAVAVQRAQRLRASSVPSARACPARRRLCQPYVPMANPYEESPIPVVWDRHTKYRRSSYWTAIRSAPATMIPYEGMQHRSSLCVRSLESATPALAQSPA